MEQMEAMLWVATMRRANQGDKEAQEMIVQENNLRIKMSQMTIQEELKEIADNYEMTTNAQTIYRK